MKARLSGHLLSLHPSAFILHPFFSPARLQQAVLICPLQEVYWLLTSGYFSRLTRVRAACCNRIQTSVTPKREVNRPRKREVE